MRRSSKASWAAIFLRSKVWRGQLLHHSKGCCIALPKAKASGRRSSDICTSRRDSCILLSFPVTTASLAIFFPPRLFSSRVVLVSTTFPALARCVQIGRLVVCSLPVMPAIPGRATYHSLWSRQGSLVSGDNRQRCTQLISCWVLRKSAIRRAISDGADRVKVCSAIYEAKRPSAEVRVPTMNAFIDKGLSVVGQQLNADDGAVMNQVLRSPGSWPKWLQLAYTQSVTMQEH